MWCGGEVTIQRIISDTPSECPVISSVLTLLRFSADLQVKGKVLNKVTHFRCHVMKLLHSPALAGGLVGPKFQSVKHVVSLCGDQPLFLGYIGATMCHFISIRDTHWSLRNSKGF